MYNSRYYVIIGLILIQFLTILLVCLIVIEKSDQILKSEIDRDDRLMSACGYVLGNE